MKVSVIVSIYNIEEYLPRAIESVCNQTFQKLEIILVDDGSTDGSAVICDNWASSDGRIKVIHKKNAGLGMARNSGMDSAGGKYIFFFDSDDYVDTKTVAKCVSPAEKNDSDAVIYALCDVYDDGRTSEKEIVTDKTFFVGDEVQNEVLPGMFTYSMGFGISSCGKMYRLSKIKELFISYFTNMSCTSRVFTIEVCQIVNKPF